MIILCDIHAYYNLAISQSETQLAVTNNPKSFDFETFSIIIAVVALYLYHICFSQAACPGLHYRGASSNYLHHFMAILFLHHLLMCLYVTKEMQTQIHCCYKWVSMPFICSGRANEVFWIVSEENAWQLFVLFFSSNLNLSRLLLHGSQMV